jgi:prepilin peptidase CpaA
MTFAVSLTAHQALIFLPFVLPICLWAMVTDLKHMIIKNYAVLALMAGFVVLGPFAFLTWEAYFWRYAHFAVVLGIGFTLWVSGIGFGAGDAKFAAAIAPFVAADDWAIFLVILSGTGVVGLILHRIAKRMPVIVNATPGWRSWEEKKTFPWGVALATALLFYLTLGFSGGF